MMLVPQHWTAMFSGWIRDDGLLLEANVRWPDGRNDLVGVPVVMWNVGVDRAPPNGEGLDILYTDLDDAWLPGTAAHEAIAAADARWPFIAEIAAVLPPRPNVFVRLAAHLDRKWRVKAPEVIDSSYEPTAAARPQVDRHTPLARKMDALADVIDSQNGLRDIPRDDWTGAPCGACAKGMACPHLPRCAELPHVG